MINPLRTARLPKPMLALAAALAISVAGGCGDSPDRKPAAAKPPIKGARIGAPAASSAEPGPGAVATRAGSESGGPGQPVGASPGQPNGQGDPSATVTNTAGGDPPTVVAQANNPDVTGANSGASRSGDPSGQSTSGFNPGDTKGPGVEDRPAGRPIFVEPGTEVTEPPKVVTKVDSDGVIHVSFTALQFFNYKPSIDLPGADTGEQGDLSGAPPGQHDLNAVPAKARDKLEAKTEIPEDVAKLNNKRVRIEGFMVPVDFEDGGTNEFVLINTIPGCWFCEQPKLNDWVEVKMKDEKRTPYVPDEPIAVYGTLEVGEHIEDGFVVSLFRLQGTEAHKVEVQ